MKSILNSLKKLLVFTITIILVSETICVSAKNIDIIAEDAECVSTNTLPVPEQTEEVLPEKAVFEGISNQKSGDLTWSLSEAGHLTITGTGDYEMVEDSSGTQAPEWITYKDYIKTASVDVDEITDISYMFYGCKKLQSIDLSQFETSNVTKARYVFWYCRGLTELDLSSFKTNNIEDFYGMFWGCSGLTTLNLTSFDTSKAKKIGGMFFDCVNLTTVDISNFNTSNVTSMQRLFEGCENLSKVDVTHFDTSNVTDMSFLFDDCKSLTELDVTHFNTANAEDMAYMFSGCSNLTTLDLSSFDTANVRYMEGMFNSCSKLTSIDISHFETKNVLHMECMFYDCSSLTSIDLSDLDTYHVVDTGAMFAGCSNLASIDLSNFNARNLMNMYRMFDGCKSLIELDLSMFEFHILHKSADYLIRGTDSLMKVVLPNFPIEVNLGKTIYDADLNPITVISSGSGTITGYSEEYTKSHCFINGHTYGVPVFTWNETLSATALFKCTREDCLIENITVVDAVITSETTPATIKTEGNVCYTATVCFEGKTYTDKKNISIPKLKNDDAVAEQPNTGKEEQLTQKEPESTQGPAKPQTDKQIIVVGKIIKSSGSKYKVTKINGSKGEVKYVSPIKRTKKTITIPATIKVDGVTYKVTAIAKNAFKNNKKLTKVTIGKNVTKIGSKAFYGCKKLKKIVIKSKKLKSVGKNAIKGINKKATIDVPNSKKKAYKKKFKKTTGYKNTMSIK